MMDLEAVDHGLFQQLREQVRSGECRGGAFRAMVREYVGSEGDDTGYDHLDLFISHLFSEREMPIPSRELEPEMVEYYKTPARVVFDFVEKFGVTAEDVFIDLGSGLGQVVLLVNLLTGARARGIEIEPVYCDYARSCAAGLGLEDVHFITADARHADYCDGTVFFLYTPFTGAMMQEVLGRLRNESLSRPIRVIPYGPCTALVENYFKAGSAGSWPWF